MSVEIKKFLAYLWFIYITALTLWVGEHYDNDLAKFCGGVLVGVCCWYVTCRAAEVIRGER